jgi:hypothetical protein
MPPGYENLDASDETHYARERRKYGGVRHLDPRYALYDLIEFQGMTVPTPTAEDWRTLELILRTPSLLSPGAKASDLANSVKDLIRSNKYERMVLVQILGYAGILQAPQYPGFLDAFVPLDLRVLPPQRFADWGYPIIWWRARDGIRHDAVELWFSNSDRDR